MTPLFIFLSAQLSAAIPNGPYLGQTPPGLTPQPFAPGIVNTPYREGNLSMTPDLREIYLVRKGGQYADWTLTVFKNHNHQWQESVVMPRIGRPILSPDGNTMHLGKSYMTRTEIGWSEVKHLGADFDAIRVMRLSSTLDGTLVFDEVGLPLGDGVLRYSQLIDGVRQTPEVFDDQLNVGLYTAHPFVAPDGSYILWDTQTPEGFGDKDLHVSFRLPNHTWSKAINLGETINTPLTESGAYVSPDGKYLFFSRNMHPDHYDNADVFWVDAQVIRDVYPGESTPAK